MISTPCESEVIERLPEMNSNTEGTVIFLKKLEKYRTEKPYCIHVPASAVPGGKFTNEEDEKVKITLRDMRPLKPTLDIDKHGFEVLDCPPVLEYSDYADKDVVNKILIPKVEAVVKQKLGASFVWCFEWKLRRRNAQFPAHVRGGDATTLQPAQGVHVDFKPDSLIWFLEKSLSKQPEHVRQVVKPESLLSSHFQALNFWRPLFGPLQDWPLALCDYSSFDLNDLEPVDHVYPDRVEETYSIYSNPGQKWYFLRDQRDDEALLFKTYDSDTEVARCTPHVSFALQDSPADARLRESIEIRLFVSYI